MSLATIDASLNPSLSSLRREDADVIEGANETKGAKADREALANEFDEFMLLLTTQLQNQDPTEPLDTNEMTSQLVQFTGVEQQIKTNDNLEQILTQNQNQQINNAVSFIGKTVQAEGSKTVLDDGQATLTFDVPAGAQSVTIAILDNAGKAIYSEAIEPQSGINNYRWDGSNLANDRKVPDGVYSYAVLARDARTETMDVRTYIAEPVTSVALEEGEPILRLRGEIDVAINDVITVTETTTNPVTTSESSTSPSEEDESLITSLVDLLSE